MVRYRGRSTVACSLCHKQKLKCSGDIPCQRCQTKGLQCTYPSKDRIVAVSQSYLHHLERQAALARGTAAEDASQHGEDLKELRQPLASTIAQPPSPVKSPGAANVSGEQNGSQLLEDCSAEHFVQKLRELSLAASQEQDSSGAGPLNPFSPTSLSPTYTYSRLKIDLFRPEVSFRLPPLPYALHLLGVFEEGFSDYHWMLRKQFHERLLVTYADPRSQAHDQTWLCCVSIVMALGEAWNCGRTRNDHTAPLDTRRLPASVLSPYPAAAEVPPGAELFEQGLLLLRSPLEEARVEDVVALNLAAFYCYSLNRRKTAYLMAGQSVRMAMMLRLHEPSPPKTEAFSAVDPSGVSDDETERIDAEHRKRVWWTSYCMDRMVSTEFGFPAAKDSLAQSIALPSNAGLGAAGRDEFFDGQVLAAQIELCRIKMEIVGHVTHRPWGGRSNVDSDPALGAIVHCMDMLRSWHISLPEDMIFSFDEGVPAEIWISPKGRVLLSLYMRYYQCLILLLRPLLLEELSSVVSSSNSVGGHPGGSTGSSSFSSPASETDSLKLECLRAAQCNCRILDSLWANGKIAKFGYWDALHLFSGIAILCLARILSLPSSTSIADAATQLSEDRGEAAAPSVPPTDQEELYVHARALLEDMARVGNPAAKDYMAMLGDVEDMVRKVLARRETYEQTLSVLLPPDVGLGGGGGGGNGSEVNDINTLFGDVPFLDTAGPSFQSILQGNNWQATDWDGQFSGYPQW